MSMLGELSRRRVTTKLCSRCRKRACANCAGIVRRKYGMPPVKCECKCRERRKP